MSALLNAVSKQLGHAPGAYYLRRPGYPSLSFINSRAQRFHVLSSSHLSLPVRLATVQQGTRSTLKQPVSLFWRAAGLTSAGLGLFMLDRSTIHGDNSGKVKDSSKAQNPRQTEGYPPPPQSSVSIYELGFGTVAGLCAGVFVKKGAKALAWFLGGVFVMLQYLNSASLVRVDWGKTAARFEKMFHTKDASGVSRPPTIVSLWNFVIDFLTADFQPRVAFIAGFALGLRVG